MSNKYWKAFKKGMICRNKKYEVGQTYEEEGANACCKAGVMHFCEEGFDVLDYYPLIDANGDFTEFAEIEPLDVVLKRGNKRASKKIKIGAKMSFEDFIIKSVEVIKKKSSSGDKARIGSRGDKAQIGSRGDKAQIGSSGDWAQIGSSGDGAQIGSSGCWARIGSSGCGARIGSSGVEAQIGSSGDGAQIGSSGSWTRIASSGDGAWIGSSGYGTQIGSSGNRAQIGSSGDAAQISIIGVDSVASAIGCGSVIKGSLGNWIVLAEWKTREDGSIYPFCVKAGQIDGVNLKPDTFYKLENGEFKEAELRPIFL